MSYPSLTRRQFLGASAALMGGYVLAGVPGLARKVWAAEPMRLAVERRTLDIKGRAASVFGIRQPDGTQGLRLKAGERFLVELTNACGAETIIHWHGQTPPYEQDGVMDANRPMLKVGERKLYDYAPHPGTHWMHSHHGLQEQLLMAAPLIVPRTEEEREDRQEVVILLHDFTFTDPAVILAALKKGGAHGHDDMEDMDMSEMAPAERAEHIAMMEMDLNDVRYDAYLANDRTLDDPQVVTVEKGGRVRLRIINGATTTAFQIDLGTLQGEAVAADGNPIKPIAGRRFGLSMGQRLDILVTLPAEPGAWPVLAQREGERERTGIILATAGADVKKVAAVAAKKVPALDLELERRMTALEPLTSKPVDATHQVDLTGSMQGYTWSLNGQRFGANEPLHVKQGQRVELVFRNRTMMAHPMHLHGHHFQVVEVDGAKIKGAVRDTVLVPIGGTVRVLFDADNPGRWPLHCHNLMHMASGMMTEAVYG